MNRMCSLRNHISYLSVHKVDNPAVLGWDANRPDSFTRESMNEILQSIGARGTETRKLAAAYTFSYLRYPLENVKKSLENLLALSLETEVPVIVHLDGVNWWGAHPELWNFFDPGKPGYDPANRANVERYDWDPDAAVKIGWRNWGSQIRVDPAPNLASPAFLAMQKQALDLLVPVIADWVRRLPEDRKYLFGGLVLGWELSPYVQAYYYEGGNDLLDKPASEDPTGGVQNSLALGYAAAETRGIQTGGELTGETVDAVCANYLDFLIDTTVQNGLPKNLLITHAFWGQEASDGGAHSGAAAVRDGILPGWSFYGGSISEMKEVYDMADGEWAMIECRPWDLDTAFFSSVYDAGAVCINIYNWESIRDDVNIRRAIREMLQ